MRNTDYMQRAISLAMLALGHSAPNPAVGAVIVKDGVIVGEGYTQPPGSDHAEVVALHQAGERARGAAMYVTLEPCCFYGRTPPCTKAIIEAGIAEVHVPMTDPNPRVSGKGMAELEEAGIKTFIGEYAEDAMEINESYVKFTARGLPFVIAKFAMSIDGKVATKTGDAKWISSEESRRYVHCLRHRVDAIMVGVNTIITDNPQLTARAGKDGGQTEKQPLRVVVDSRGRIPLDSRVFQVPGKTLVAVTEEIEPAKSKALTEAGADVLPLPSKGGMVDLGELLIALGKKGIVNLLVEGGPTVFGTLFEQGLVDRLLAFVSPLIIGGTEASSPVKGVGVDLVSQAMLLDRVKVERFSDDVLISAYAKQD